MTRRRARLALLAVAVSLGLVACAVPRERDDLALRKQSADPSEIEAVYERYRKVRSTAVEVLDSKPLSTVMTGPVLAIDSGSFEVAQRLSTDRTAVGDSAQVEPLATPRFTSYPLWFVATERDESAEVTRVQVFERARAVDPWLLVASPETVLDTDLPELRVRDGVALPVTPDSDTGMAMSAQEAAAAYAQTLVDPQDEAADGIEADDFIAQMREAADQNASLDGVEFSQTWAAEPVEHVLRTADGGALAFVTLLRLDTYEVEDGVTVTWPEGSPQQAFLATGISTSGRLRYYHQVLVHLPGGREKPRALGQYGGVVDADGF